MNREELKELIEKNPRGYHRTLSGSKYADFRNKLATQYPNLKQAERCYLYAHNMNKPICKNCNKKHTRFVNIIDGHKIFCSEKCSIEWHTVHSEMTNKIKKQPKNPPECVHVHCNKPVVKNKNGLWSQFCSTKCRGIHNSLISRNKSQQTMMKNHGVEHALKSSKFRDKARNTYLDRYGYENPLGDIKVQERIKQTNLKRYGVKNSFQNKEIQERHKNVLLNKYGVDKMSQIDGVMEKKLNSGHKSKDYTLPSGDTIKVQGYENIFLDAALNYYDESMFTYNCKGIKYLMEGKKRVYFPDFELPDSNDVIEVKSDYTFSADYDKNIKKAQGVVDNDKNHNIVVYDEKHSYSPIYYGKETLKVKALLDGIGIEYKMHENVGEYVIDFLVKGNADNIAIIIKNEKFTNEYFVDKYYYKDMVDTLMNNGITPLVVNKTDFSKKYLDMIKHKIGLNDESRVYARSLTVVSNISKGVKLFFDQNHIQNYAASKIAYALMDDRNNIKAAMLFNEHRKGTGKDRGKGSFELVRFATNGVIVGAASRLLSHFEKDYNPTLIYSYSDKFVSSGDLYATLGFELEKETPPDYRYYIYGHEKTLGRFRFRKGALKEKFPDTYDDSLTERQLMKMNGYCRLYDAGKKTWVKRLK